MHILGDLRRTDPPATMKQATEPRDAIDPDTFEGLQAIDAAHASLQDQLQTGEIAQDAYEEAWTDLIAAVPPAVLKASMEKRPDAVQDTREEDPGIAEA